MRASPPATISSSVVMSRLKARLSSVAAAQVTEDCVMRSSWGQERAVSAAHGLAHRQHQDLDTQAH